MLKILAWSLWDFGPGRITKEGKAKGKKCISSSLHQGRNMLTTNEKETSSFRTS